MSVNRHPASWASGPARELGAPDIPLIVGQLGAPSVASRCGLGDRQSGAQPLVVRPAKRHSMEIRPGSNRLRPVHIARKARMNVMRPWLTSPFHLLTSTTTAPFQVRAARRAPTTTEARQLSCPRQNPAFDPVESICISCHRTNGDTRRKSGFDPKADPRLSSVLTFRQRRCPERCSGSFTVRPRSNSWGSRQGLPSCSSWRPSMPWYPKERFWPC